MWSSCLCGTHSTGLIADFLLILNHMFENTWEIITKLTAVKKNLTIKQVLDVPTLVPLGTRIPLRIYFCYTRINSYRNVARLPLLCAIDLRPSWCSFFWESLRVRSFVLCKSREDQLAEWKRFDRVEWDRSYSADSCPINPNNSYIQRQGQPHPCFPCCSVKMFA